MSIEENIGPMPDIEKDKLTMDKHFRENTGLSADAFNDWLAISVFRPVKYYQEYFAEKYPHLVDYIMQKSSPEKVKEFDLLVDEFNAELEEIKKNNDQAAIDYYFNRASELTRG